MIPKTIHLCWFGGDPFPVEIKRCICSWNKYLPDYRIRMWTYQDAEKLDIPYVNEALKARKWAFAADVVRFYAIWAEGGVYMDSDILLLRRFDELMTAQGVLTFNECLKPGEKVFGLQAAFIMGEKGATYCKDMVDYYSNHHFLNADGSFDQTISPYVMRDVAEKYGYCMCDKEQHLEGLTVMPTYLLSPSKSYPHHSDVIGIHRIYGSWRHRHFWRRVDIQLHHYYYALRYFYLKPKLQNHES